MKTILCYGDSNTYGLSPEWMKGKPGRHDIHTRWTGLLQAELGTDFRVIEEGLNGRTTVFDDPTVSGRRGIDFAVHCVETHNPVDLFVVNLGGNDAKRIFGAQASEISAGLSRLLKSVLDPYAYMVYGPPRHVLVCSPTAIGEAALHLGDDVTDRAMIDKIQQLPKYYAQTAEQLGCSFVDLSSIQPSDLDGIHLSAEGHRQVADALITKIREIFPEG